MIEAESVTARDKSLNVTRSGNFLTHESAQRIIREYVDAILEIGSCHDREGLDPKALRAPEHLWRDDISPRLGSSRVARTFGPQMLFGKGPPPRIRPQPV